MDFSIIIIVSFDRVDALGRLLGKVAEHFAKFSFEFEMLVAINARDEAVAQAIDGIVARYADGALALFRRVRETLPVKCRGHNRAIAKSQGAILVSWTMMSR